MEGIMSSEKIFPPFGTNLDLIHGVMFDPDIHLVRRASGMRGHYRNSEALEELIRDRNDPIHYEVFEKDIPEESGHLRFSISKLQPGVIDGECFMTKGHYHSIPESAEIYLCLRGEGYMLLKTSAGECEVVAMKEGRLVYVPPFWAHRSVNTGGEPLVSLCVYPAGAGHNYGDIEREGFPKRIYKREGKIDILSLK